MSPLTSSKTKLKQRLLRPAWCVCDWPFWLHVWCLLENAPPSCPDAWAHLTLAWENLDVRPAAASFYLRQPRAETRPSEREKLWTEAEVEYSAWTWFRTLAFKVRPIISLHCSLLVRVICVFLCQRWQAVSLVSYVLRGPEEPPEPLKWAEMT